MRSATWLAATLVLLVACGDDEEPTWDEQGAGLCAEAQAAVDALDAPLDLVEFGDRAGSTADVLTALADDLAGLVPTVDATVDLTDGRDTVVARLRESAETLDRAKRAAALGNTDDARDEWRAAQTWGDDAEVADAVGLGDCVLDLEHVQPPIEGATPTEPPVTEPPVTDPPETDPPETEPPDPDGTEPGEGYTFEVFDPTDTLLLPDGYDWVPYDEDDHREFLDTLARSDFAPALTGVSVGSVLDAEGNYVMLVRELVWSDVVEGSEIATSLDEIYLQGTASDTAVTLAGVDGVSYVDDDGTSGWVGHTGEFSIVVQFPADLEGATAIGEAYVALNYGD